MLLEKSNGEEFSPLRTDQLQKWLDKVLHSSMTVYEKDTAHHSGGLTASQYFKIDRDSLSQRTLDKRAIDRIYRSLYVYSTGIHQIVRECSQPDTEKVVTYTLWNVFIRLLEHCDPAHSQLLLKAHETEQGEYLLNIIDKYKEQVQRTTAQGEYFHNLFKETDTKLTEKTECLDKLTLEFDDYKKQAEEQHRSLRESFAEEHEARIQAESTIAGMRVQITEMQRTNEYLKERVTILKDGMHTSMDESYRFQESSKLYFKSATDLSFSLQQSEARVRDLNEKLENEFRQRMDWMDKHSALSFKLQTREQERDTLSNDVIHISKLYRSVSDCLNICLTIAPAVLSYVDVMESWKNTIVSSVDPELEEAFAGFESLVLLQNFASMKEAMEYFGVGSAYSTNKDKFIETARHFSELLDDLQSVTSLNRENLTSIATVIDKYKADSEALGPTICTNVVTIEKLCAEKVARQCMSSVYMLGMLQAIGTSEGHLEALHELQEDHEQLLEETREYKQQKVVKNAIEHALRNELKACKEVIESTTQQLIETNVALKTTQHAVEQLAFANVNLETSLASVTRDMNNANDTLVKADALIVDLKYDLQEHVDMCKVMTKNKVNIMSVFPMLLTEVTAVLDTLQTAFQGCQDIGLDVTAPVDSETRHQYYEIRQHMDAVCHLGLGPDDQQSILAILKALKRVVSSTSLINVIGNQTIQLSVINKSLRVDVDKLQHHIDKERKRMVDVMHYASDMETFSKGLLQGNAGNSSQMGQMFSSQRDKERSQNAVIEAKELWRREHEQRIFEKDRYETSIDQLRQVIVLLEKEVAQLKHALDKHGSRFRSVSTQTDVVDCSSCREFSGKLLRANMELERERCKICEQCILNKRELNELATVRASYARSQLIVDNMNVKIESLIRECEELRVKGAVRRTGILVSSSNPANDTIASTAVDAVEGAAPKSPSTSRAGTAGSSPTKIRFANAMDMTDEDDPIDALLRSIPGRTSSPAVTTNSDDTKYLRRSGSAGDSETGSRTELSSLFKTTSIEVDGVPQVLGSKWKQLRLHFLSNRVGLRDANNDDISQSERPTIISAGTASPKKPTTPTRTPPTLAMSPLKQNRPKLPLSAVKL
jgi:hypothetical protein